MVLKSLSLLRIAYVPGATHVFLRGLVSRSNELLGSIRIGEAQIQVSEVLASNPQIPKVGEIVEVLGTQANPKGIVWANLISRVESPSTPVNEGTGVASIQGIEGTGKASIQGIEGTGKATIQGIEGTGKASIQGIEGTGKASIQGIEGTGKLAP